MTSMPPARCAPVQRRDKGPGDLSAGCVPTRMHDPVGVMPAFAGEQHLTVGTGVKLALIRIRS